MELLHEVEAGLLRYVDANVAVALTVNGRLLVLTADNARGAADALERDASSTSPDSARGFRALAHQVRQSASQVDARPPWERPQ